MQNNRGYFIRKKKKRKNISNRRNVLEKIITLLKIYLVHWVKVVLYRF
jgi:hypothetical protein